MPEFPSYEEWKAPWEKNGTELDAEKARKLVYKQERQAAIDAQKHEDEKAALQGELDKAKTDLQEKASALTKLQDEQIEDAAERARVQQERFQEQMLEAIRGAKQEPAEQENKGATEADRLRAALKLGLSERQAARLQGSTYDELLEDGRALLEEIGLTPIESGVGYDVDGDMSGMPSRVPSRGGFRTDLGGSVGSQAFDPAKERDLIGR